MSVCTMFGGSALGAGVFQELDGLVVMEVESTPVVSPWVEETALAGFTGSSYYRMTINDFDPSTPSGELVYRFNIGNPGTYRLRTRGWKPDVGDIGEHNDCWVKMVGHPGDEGIYNKLFMGGAAGVWGWDTTYHIDELYKPRYNLSSGEHELRIAGRSDEYVIDRIILYREDMISTGDASNINNPQSPIATPQGMLQFNVSNYSVAEGNGGTKTVTVTVTRVGGTSGAVSVDYATSDGAATLADNDYEDASNTLIWADGDGGNKTFTVTLNGDTNEENSEYFNITLSNATGGATLGLQNTATVTITNDDGISLGWSYQAWTDDTTSGIDSSFPYTAAHHFCNSHTGGVTVNEVYFTGGRVTSGTGWNVGGAIHWYKDSSVNITGDSAYLADQFLFGAEPRTVQFTGLTIDKTYKASFFSVAWGDGARVQTFSSEGNDLVLDQNIYGNNNGIVISYTYVATAASQNFTITPALSETFHLYALANSEVPVQFVDPNAPSVDAGPDMIAWSGADVPMAPTIVEVNDSDWTSLTYEWTTDAPAGYTVTWAPSNTVEAPTVAITKDAPVGGDGKTVVTLTLAVNNAGNPPEAAVTDKLSIDLYDDACQAGKADDPDSIQEGDINADCIINLVDFAIVAQSWLVDTALDESVPLVE